jgi:uncharacterized CHY-type Zn-finger protein
MKSEKKHLNKIICLFYPPLLNNFGFRSEPGIKFFTVKKNPEISQFLAELSPEEKIGKLVLLNYPQQEEQFNELRVELTKSNQQITNVVLCNFENYNLLSEIQDKYLICPSCEKMFVKETNKQKNGWFICPRDNSEFAPQEIANFNQNYLENYFKNSKILLEKILAADQKTAPVKINQLIIRQKEELFSGEIREKIWEIINNI